MSKQRVPIFTKVFRSTLEAETWCATQGLAVGLGNALKRGVRREARTGDTYLAAWHRLSVQEKRDLDGMLFHDRHGVFVIWMYTAAEGPDDILIWQEVG